MKETLKYFLSFADPKTREVLFSPKGTGCVQFRTQNLPRVGDIIKLVFTLHLNGKKRSSTHTYRLRLEVVEVERRLQTTDPKLFEFGNPVYVVEESIFFSITVVPITKKFDGTIRLLQQFYASTAEQYREWRESHREKP
jgi:hypothetical protein